MPDIYAKAEEFKARLLHRERRASSELVRLYAGAYKRIQPEIEKVLKKIDDARAEGFDVSPSWLLQRDRLRALEFQIAVEMSRFAQEAARSTTAEQLAAIRLAQHDSQSLIAASLSTTRGSIDVQFARLPTDALEALAGLASDGSRIGSLFGALVPLASQKIKKELFVGLALGKSSRAIASDLRDALGGNMARALTVARTETLRAYRESTRQTYAANSDVVEGWTWAASLSTRTCAMCWAMDGTKHKSDESLDSHPNCRCVMVPLIVGSTAKVESGSDAFAKLVPSAQLEILGQGKFAAYQAGKLQLSDLVATNYSTRYGTTRYEQSLKDALHR